jgi:hypothetical protein
MDRTREYVMANVQKRRVVVVHPRVDEASVRSAGANGKVDNLDAKTGSEASPSPNASPIEFGWDVFDFPFNSPKLTR